MKRNDEGAQEYYRYEGEEAKRYLVVITMLALSIFTFFKDFKNAKVVAVAFLIISILEIVYILKDIRKPVITLSSSTLVYYPINGHKHQSLELAQLVSLESETRDMLRFAVRNGENVSISISRLSSGEKEQVKQELLLRCASNSAGI
jgi:hypothetical protein